MRESGICNKMIAGGKNLTTKLFWMTGLTPERFIRQATIRFRTEY